MSMAITNPELIASLLFTEKGTLSRVEGEALYSFGCKAVIVKIRKPEECTNEILVISNHKQ